MYETEIASLTYDQAREIVGSMFRDPSLLGAVFSALMNAARVENINALREQAQGDEDQHVALLADDFYSRVHQVEQERQHTHPDDPHHNRLNSEILKKIFLGAEIAHHHFIPNLKQTEADIRTRGLVAAADRVEKALTLQEKLRAHILAEFPARYPRIWDSD